MCRQVTSSSHYSPVIYLDFLYFDSLYCSVICPHIQFQFIKFSSLLLKDIGERQETGWRQCGLDSKRGLRWESIAGIYYKNKKNPGIKPMFI